MNKQSNNSMLSIIGSFSFDDDHDYNDSCPWTYSCSSDSRISTTLDDEHISVLGNAIDLLRSDEDNVMCSSNRNNHSSYLSSCQDSDHESNYYDNEIVDEALMNIIAEDLTSEAFSTHRSTTEIDLLEKSSLEDVTRHENAAIDNDEHKESRNNKDNFDDAPALLLSQYESAKCDRILADETIIKDNKNANVKETKPPGMVITIPNDSGTTQSNPIKCPSNYPQSSINRYEPTENKSGRLGRCHNTKNTKMVRQDQHHQFNSYKKRKYDEPTEKRTMGVVAPVAAQTGAGAGTTHNDAINGNSHNHRHHDHHHEGMVGIKKRKTAKNSDATYFTNKAVTVSPHDDNITSYTTSTVVSGKKKKAHIVGPDSPQMASISRILSYLKQNDTIDRKLVSQVSDVIHDCEERFCRRERKFLNLPGAIFEKLIENIGATSFGTIFRESQRYHEQHKTKPTSFSTNTDCVIDQKKKESQSRSQQQGHGLLSSPLVSKSRSGVVISKPAPPNTLEIAVAYGMHLARMAKMEETTDNANSVDLVDVVKRGAETVALMSDEERACFWESMSACHEWQ